MAKNVPPKRILVPLDFSRESRVALAYADSIARPLGATVVLFNAVPTNKELAAALPFGAMAGGAELDEWIEALHEEASRALQEESGMLGHRNFERMVGDGSPAEAILEAIRETGCDLVVMGSHGRTGLRRALMGSVAEKTVRLSPVPVLVVRWSEDGKPGDD